MAHNHQYKSRVLLGEFKTPWLVIWLMKHFPGIIKTERQAAYVMYGATLIFFSTSIILFWLALKQRVIYSYFDNRQFPAEEYRDSRFYKN